MIEFKEKDIHFQELKKLQAILKQQTHFTLKPSTTSNALRNKVNTNHLDLSSFTEALELSKEERWILVESRIPFKKLCEITLQYGLIPPVVPEFTSITVGGAIMGAALESSSHRFGQVSDTTLEYELLLGNGEIITASKEKNSDLFYALSGSYGTLAILTAVKLKLIEAKKWVHLWCEPFNDLKKMVETLAPPHKHDFVEGIVLEHSKGVVIRGEMQKTSSKDIFYQNHTWSPWYVQKIASEGTQKFCMPLLDYLFRLDRGAFWIARYINSWTTLIRLLFRLGIPKPKKNSIHPSFLFRFFFGWALSSQKLYQLWHRIPNHVTENLFFIHDFYIPFPKAFETLNHFISKTKIFPIWLCPIKGTRTAQFLSPHYGNEGLLNIGLYGMPQGRLSAVELTKQLENAILEFGGRKMLYSFTYYDKEIFAKIYQKPLYDELRKKFYTEKTFPTLYNKVINYKTYL